jgi:hypothetical protein
MEKTAAYPSSGAYDSQVDAAPLEISHLFIRFEYRNQLLALRPITIEPQTLLKARTILSREG